MSDIALHVLAVSPIADVGGAEVLLVEVLRGLKHQGANTGLIVLGEGPLVDLAGTHAIPVFRGPRLSFRNPGSVMRSGLFVRTMVRRLRPDIVHASHPRAGLLSRLALVGEAVAYTTQHLEPPSSRDLVGRLCLRLDGTHIVLTPDMARAHSKQREGLCPIVIEPGVDADRLLKNSKVGDPERCWARSPLTPSGGPRIVMVARLQPFKGPGDFIAMASQVLESRPDARFLIIGPDSSRSPGLRIQLESRIDELGLRNQIALAGPLSEEDLAATVSHSTLLVHPAHREGFGLVLVEAMALGTPVVAYAASGPRHILGHGGGTLVKVGDTRALADCVLAALHDSTLLELWRKQCLPVAQHFSLERMTVGYLSVMRPKC